jgi:tRNA A-37 threonylcarbamoyl transferase component Bud32
MQRTSTHHARPSQQVKWHLEQKGRYSVQCLPPYKRFRGNEMPWDHPVELDETTEQIIKSTRSRKVVKLAAGQYGTPLELFVKRYNFKTWYGPYLRMARQSRAREEFELGWALMDAGIRTPRPVWLAEEQRTPSRYSLLATEAIPLAESVLQRWLRLTEESDRTDLIRAVGQFLYLLHERGLYHDDCKAAHILVRLESPSSPKEFFIIDLLGCGLKGRLSHLERAKNLYQVMRHFHPPKGSIGFSPEHRELLLTAYGGSRQDAEKWSRWVDRIGRLKGKKY